jgi:rhamnulokinase
MGHEMAGAKNGQLDTVEGLTAQNPCWVAVDLGASSGRVIAAQLTHGRLVLHEVSRFSTAFSADPESGFLCWNVDAIEDEIRRGIERTAAMAPIVSVGVDSWGVDYVLLDARLHRVGKTICYRDSRTEGMIERVTRQISAGEIYRRTGIQFQPFNTLYQLAAMAAQEQQWVRDTRHLLMIPDYFHFRLSGVMANEYTNATTTQLLGLRGEWDEELFAAAGVPHSWMKPPVEAGTVLGALRFGDSGAQVVAPATHDTASAVAGTPLESENEAFLSSGTWSLLGIESLISFASEQAGSMNFSNEGGIGRRYRVLKNIMGLWLLQRISREFEIPIDDALLNAVAVAKPWRSIVNPDDARFLNPTSMREAICAYCRETGQPEPSSAPEFARCALESLALRYRMVKEELELLRGQSLTRIRIVGGGSQNRILNQLCADACQLPVSAGPIEASALGNIVAQMIATGHIAGISEARALIRRSIDIVDFYPRDPIPDHVWSRFRDYSATRLQEMMQ